MSIVKDHKGALLAINDIATDMLKMDKTGSEDAEAVEEKTIELLQDWNWTVEVALITPINQSPKEKFGFKPPNEILVLLPFIRDYGSLRFERRLP